ncbi:hypothetical protein I307_03473 [Cryptococcus deuterogattii 99/473]|uniref:Unplaced genomic scaffold supercont1.1, whole genome shotgun sequence n=1 Tax=Cryptococcus deuterogattii Ram5 TaxID=1296110 RepID=A0A0D0VF08_9TREE|nr:hypothetical protein I309_00501 [Cryptococcus deuterogattii LA55]KIR36974.1 hypothetical protein I352_00286 [Cryptococcus deuterogattii MMRL2647]KIR43445.1 hypothetical protein I313_00287 [Cryptococcus deuterogattii Ram5]KIR74778.1 hypothetical protein I310_01052 [Cryptococcus deuterogattii CA1014]KIR92295.1 hypothetical protein I304_03699 [Cryptococcus deuterogattii CBS 10090]KIS01461.1 hypothetical protein L804_01339 [Cryptococcus deuterogattii 2001/935-1]KIY57139.1 hypothetical protein 
MSQSQPPRPPLNIPSGSSQITPDPEPLKPDETLSGDKIRDFKAARINPKQDLENIGKIPCARNSLLYGIAGGVGVGADPGWQPTGLLVALSRFPSFSARRKELAQMRIIQERYPHRHVSKLQKSGQDSEVRQGEQQSP